MLTVSLKIRPPITLLYAKALYVQQFFVTMTVIMLFLSTKLYNVPLFSIRSGGRIGSVTEPIINPHNLHIDGFYCQTPNGHNNEVLLDIYIRDISSRGIIIDDHNNLSSPDELVRLQPVINLNFSLVNLNAVVSKKKVGKISQFAVDTESLFIQKFYVQPRGWQSFKTDSLTFDRTSVVEVNNAAIIFKGPEVKDTKAIRIGSPGPKLETDYSASANASAISE